MPKLGHTNIQKSEIIYEQINVRFYRKRSIAVGNQKEEMSGRILKGFLEELRLSSDNYHSEKKREFLLSWKDRLNERCSQVWEQNCEEKHITQKKSQDIVLDKWRNYPCFLYPKYWNTMLNTKVHYQCSVNRCLTWVLKLRLNGCFLKYSLNTIKWTRGHNFPSSPRILGGLMCYLMYILLDRTHTE